MFKPLNRRGKNTFKTHTQNVYRLKKMFTPKHPSVFLCERRRLRPLLNSEIRFCTCLREIELQGLSWVTSTGHVACLKKYDRSSPSFILIPTGIL